LACLSQERKSTSAVTYLEQIAPLSAPEFILVQMLGAIAANSAFKWLQRPKASPPQTHNAD